MEYFNLQTLFFCLALAEFTSCTYGNNLHGSGTNEKKEIVQELLSSEINSQKNSMNIHKLRGRSLQNDDILIISKFLESENDEIFDEAYSLVRTRSELPEVQAKIGEIIQHGNARKAGIIAADQCRIGINKDIFGLINKRVQECDSSLEKRVILFNMLFSPCVNKFIHFYLELLHSDDKMSRYFAINALDRLFGKKFQFNYKIRPDDQKIEIIKIESFVNGKNIETIKILPLEGLVGFTFDVDEKNKCIKVLNVIPGCSADLNGLKIGSCIFMINNDNVAGKLKNELVEFELHGKEDSKIELEVRNGEENGGMPYEIEVTRKACKFSSMKKQKAL